MALYLTLHSIVKLWSHLVMCGWTWPLQNSCYWGADWSPYPYLPYSSASRQWQAFLLLSNRFAVEIYSLLLEPGSSVFIVKSLWGGRSVHTELGAYQDSTTTSKLCLRYASWSCLGWPVEGQPHVASIREFCSTGLASEADGHISQTESEITMWLGLR